MSREQAEFFFNVDDWERLREFAENHKQFKANQLLWLKRNRKTNGFDKAFRKIGKEYYINSPIFAACVLDSE